MKLLRAAQATITELPSGELPEWIQLLPAGKCKTRDGRAPWINKDPEKIVRAFQSFGMELPGDFEHQSMAGKEKTGPVGASGWIDKMEVRGAGEIWGRVKWTEQSADLIAKREYRYISPVFDYDPNTREIVNLVSFALTNNPNLYLRAVATQEGATKMPGLKEKLVKAMNDMAENAEDEAVKESIAKCMADHFGDGEAPKKEDEGGGEAPRKPVAPQEELTAKPAENARQSAAVDLSKYVPMSQFNALSDKVTAQENEMKGALIDAAVAEGRITSGPAREDYAQMSQHLTRAELKAKLDRLPKVFAGNTSRTAPPVITPEVAAQTLTDSELAMCSAFGRSPVEYATLKLANEKETAAKRGH